MYIIHYPSAHAHVVQAVHPKLASKKTLFPDVCTPNHFHFILLPVCTEALAWEEVAYSTKLSGSIRFSLEVPFHHEPSILKVFLQEFTL